MITWQDAEVLAAEHLQAVGFKEVRRMPDGPDAGVDVVGTGVIAQVKSWNTPVGISEVQRLRGTSLNDQDCVFYSRSGYTRSALTWADTAGVALFTFDEFRNVTPVNQAATSLDPPPSLQNGERIEEVRTEFPALMLKMMRHDLAKHRTYIPYAQGVASSGITVVPDGLLRVVQKDKILAETLAMSFAWHEERNLIWRLSNIRTMTRFIDEIDSEWSKVIGQPVDELLPKMSEFVFDQTQLTWRHLGDSPV